MARDRHCQFPGCLARHCDAHHLVHWSDGGTTRLTNLALLCRRHHRAVHEEGFRLTRAPDGTITVRGPNGRRLPAAPPVPRWAARAADAKDPLAPSTARLAAAGIQIGPHTATPHWYGERLDLHYALDVLRDYPLARGRTVSADGAIAGLLEDTDVHRDAGDRRTQWHHAANA